MKYIKCMVGSVFFFISCLAGGEVPKEVEIAIHANNLEPQLRTGTSVITFIKDLMLPVRDSNMTFTSFEGTVRNYEINLRPGAIPGSLTVAEMGLNPLPELLSQANSALSLYGYFWEPIQKNPDVRNHFYKIFIGIFHTATVLAQVSTQNIEGYNQIIHNIERSAYTTLAKWSAGGKLETKSLSI